MCCSVPKDLKYQRLTTCANLTKSCGRQIKSFKVWCASYLKYFHNFLNLIKTNCIVQHSIHLSTNWYNKIGQISCMQKEKPLCFKECSLLSVYLHPDYLKSEFIQHIQNYHSIVSFWKFTGMFISRWSCPSMV